MSERSPADHMALALQLAARGRHTSFPNPSVGCVIVRDGRVVGHGWHSRAGEPHAEAHALREAGSLARGAEVFVTLEPCSHHGRTPPCADALIGAGVRKVWAAMRDPNPLVAGQGLAALQAAGIEVDVGLLRSAARELHRGFVSRMERGRPHLTLKLGASLDGRTAMASGESKWITGVAARADVQRLRAEAGAVLSSSATVLADDPALSLRGDAWCGRQADRIVVDSAARVPSTAQVWKADGARRIWLVGLHASIASLPVDVECLRLAAMPDGMLDLPTVLIELGRLQINSVLVECGPRLAGALLGQSLVDELVCYLAPSLLGDAARGLAVLPGLERLDQRVELRFTDVRQVGEDLRLTAVPRQGVH